MSDDFFRQATPVSARAGHRQGHLQEWMSSNGLHLHVGCADWPIFDALDNLHLTWLEAGYQIDGLDPATETLLEMQRYAPNARFFDSITDELREREYDCLVIPETIEHVGDVASFLGELASLQAQRFAISTPNALFGYAAYIHESVAYEEIHPDHNCWFTPYTLRNVIAKYAPGWQLADMLVVDEGRTLVARGTCQ